MINDLSEYMLDFINEIANKIMSNESNNQPKVVKCNARYTFAFVLCDRFPCCDHHYTGKSSPAMSRTHILSMLSLPSV